MRPDGRTGTPGHLSTYPAKERNAPVAEDGPPCNLDEISCGSGDSVVMGPGRLVVGAASPGGDCRDDAEEDECCPGDQVGQTAGEAVAADRDAGRGLAGYFGWCVRAGRATVEHSTTGSHRSPEVPRHRCGGPRPATAVRAEVPRSRHHNGIRCPEADDAEADSDHPMHDPFHVLGAGRLLILSRDGTVEPNPVGRTRSSCAGVKTTVGEGVRITELCHRPHSQHWTGRSHGNPGDLAGARNPRSQRISFTTPLRPVNIARPQTRLETT